MVHPSPYVIQITAGMLKRTGNVRVVTDEIV